MAVRQSSQRTRVIAIVSGLAVAVLGVAGTVYLSRNSQTQGPGPAGTSGRTVKVVIARIPISQGSKITLSEVTTADVAAAVVSQDALTDPAAAANLYAGVDISSNQVITPGLLIQAPQAGPLQVSLIKLKDGDVAIAIPNDPIKGAGGYIQAGDHIDILVDINGGGLIKYGFQDVPVLKAGSSGHTEGVSDVLVIELPRRQAEQLTLILSAHNTPANVVKYALRPAGQKGKGYLGSGPDVPPDAAAANDAPVTPQQMNTIFNSG